MEIAECRFNQWTPILYKEGLSSAAPAVSGIYAIIKVKRVGGLPLSSEVLYIGQSRNLRRRFGQHVDESEPNPYLFEISTQSVGRDLEFWWLPVSPQLLNNVEADLIRLLKPPANRRLYKTHRAPNNKYL